jgi:hypothetical protein
MWSPDGRRLVYLDGPGRHRFVAVDILSTTTSFVHAKPRVLFLAKQAVNTFGEGGRITDMSPDGKFVVAIQGEAEPVGSEINVILNWLDAVNGPHVISFRREEK